MTRLSIPTRRTAVCAALLAPAALTAQGAEPLRLEREVLVRLDDASSPARPVDLAVRGNGEIYVLWNGPGRIDVHSTAGARVRTLPGASGAEMRSAAAGRSIWFRGDTLVSQPGGRLTLFHADGTHLRTVEAPSGLRGASGVEVSALLVDGTLLVWPTVRMDASADGRVTSVPFLRVHRAGAVMDTVVHQALRHSVYRVAEPRAGGTQTFGSQPWRDHDIVVIPPDGRWVALVARPADGNAVRVRVRRPGGAVAYDRTLETASLPLPPEEVRATAKRLADEILPGATDAEALVRAALFVPRHRPSVTDAVAGRDGTLWLRREDTGAASVRWTVLAADGTVAGEVNVPASLRILEAERGRVWGFQTDGAGRVSLAVHRVTRAR